MVDRPERERWGDYVPFTLGDRDDALLWFGATAALEPVRPEPADDPERETALRRVSQTSARSPGLPARIAAMMSSLSRRSWMRYAQPSAVSSTVGV